MGLTLTLRQLTRYAVVLASWGALGGPGGAQELRRQYCDPEDPDLGCPGPGCMCVPDRLEITFDGESQSTLEYAEFRGEMPFEVTLVLDARSERIHSWFYGVAHDPSVVSLVGATTEGTNFPSPVPTFFEVIAIENVETCLTEECSWSDPTQRKPGGGWIFSVVLSVVPQVYMPLGRSPVTRAQYRLLKDVGEAGTTIRVSDELALEGAPRSKPALEIQGSVYYWSEVTDGWIRRSPTAASPFLRGDVGVLLDGVPGPADGIFTTGDAIRILLHLFRDQRFELSCEKAADVNDDGAVDVSDAIYLLRFLFIGGDHGPPPAPFPQVGPDPTPDALGCEEYP